MSLVVWLPLDGNLNNQGLSSINVTNGGATVAEEGKIGKCYSFGTSTSYLSIPPEAMTSFTTEASVCFWIKILSWNTSWATYFQAGTNGNPWNYYRFGFLRNSSGSNCAFVLGNGSSTTTTSYTTPTLELNKWYHIGLIYKTGYCAIYINGNLHNEYAPTIVPAFAGITHITIGMANNKSSYQTNCLLNDFRIYDHCLSAREVKEISKALFLHYKLDDNFTGYEYDITEPDGSKWTHLIHHNNPAGGVFPSGSNFAEGVFVDENRWFNAYPTLQKYNGFEFLLKTKLTSGASETKYRWVQRKSPLTATWEDCSTNYVTRTTSTGYTNGTLGGGMYILNNNTHFCIANKTKGNWFGALGSWTAYQGGTPGFPNNVVTTGYMDLYMRTDIIYDVSGYHRNGSIVGTFTMNTDSPKYSKGSTFAAGNNHIISPTLHTAGIQDSYTISWWSQSTGMSGKMAWGSYNGNRLNLYPSGSAFYWNTGDGTNNPIKNGSSNLAFAGFQGAAWHHYAMTGDGSTGKLYIDGSLRGTASTYKPFTATVVCVSGWDLTASYVWPGKVSDFRIYGTCLSAEDVFELSHTPAYIDNLSDQMMYELVEPCDNIFKSSYLISEARITTGNGSIIDRNGTKAIMMQAGSFYYAANDDRNIHLQPYFKENTRYVFDLWMDMDDEYNPNNNTNYAAGLRIYYTDNSTSGSDLFKLGSVANPIGFQHIRYITPAGKSIKGIYVSYNYGRPQYYRLDSTITEYHEPDVTIKKTGVLECANLKEQLNRPNAAYGKGGDVEVRSGYEI